MPNKQTLAKMKAQQKYCQEHPLIGIRVSQEQMDFLKEEAIKRRWSVANLVAYALEEYFNMPPSDIRRR